MLSYPETDVFCLVYNIANYQTLLNISYRWIPEIWHYAPGTPIILVGAQVDLRTQTIGNASRASIGAAVMGETLGNLEFVRTFSKCDMSIKCVSYNEGKQLADKLKYCKDFRILRLMS